MDDLLHLLDQFKLFSMLDLVSRYWQVKVNSDLHEKTAFITHHDLYQFSFMPFGLQNAPIIFQSLMQRVLAGLNCPEGPDFVSVYLNDINILSTTLEDHLHLWYVIEHISKVGLNVKPSKCHFVSQEVHYLGYLLTHEEFVLIPTRLQQCEITLHQRKFNSLSDGFLLQAFCERLYQNCTASSISDSKGASFCWSPVLGGIQTTA